MSLLTVQRRGTTNLILNCPPPPLPQKCLFYLHLYIQVYKSDYPLPQLRDVIKEGSFRQITIIQLCLRRTTETKSGAENFYKLSFASKVNEQSFCLFISHQIQINSSMHIFLICIGLVKCIQCEINKLGAITCS